MSMAVPAAVDPEIAAAVLATHVRRVEQSEQARDAGWRFNWLDPLHVVVEMIGQRTTGERDQYYVKLGAEFYDLYPPTTAFVCPPDSAGEAPGAAYAWPEAPAGSRWLPVVNGLPWLAIHSNFAIFADGRPRQLVCCSMTYEYYITSHAPTSGQRWQQGRHTIAATLNRLQEALTSQYYQGPAGAIDT